MNGIVAPDYGQKLCRALPNARLELIREAGHYRRIEQPEEVADAIDAGLVFASTPDDVIDQLRAFYDHVGGFGHLLTMGQGGLISHEDTVENLTLFSREVLPRVADLGQ